LFHVLEHVRDPVNLLRGARSLLVPNGRLVVVVPTYSKVQTDFHISEHLHHFTEGTLDLAARNAGLTLMTLPVGLLGSIEIGFLGTPTISHEAAAKDVLDYSKSLVRSISRHLAARKGPVGIFGVGGSGIWLGKLFNKEIAFYVDEDPKKVGKVFCDIPIVGVAEITAGSTVYIALNTVAQSSALAARLQVTRPDVAFIVL
jgi:hypothetical protein